MRHLGFLALLAFASPAFAGPETEVTIVLPAGPDRLDPCETPRSVIGRIIKQNVVETLVELNYADATLMPRLAESWTQDGPTEWTFKLRPGVTFHDGAPFDAAAVIYSMERTIDPALTCITRTKFFDGVDITPTAVDPLTVKFTTAQPSPILPTLLAQMAISSPNTPKGVYTNKPIGTGPYRFVEWVQGQDVVIERTDNYWGEQPVITKATYVWRSESSVVAAMVATNEADLAFSVAPQDATDPAMDKVYPNSDRPPCHVRLSSLFSFLRAWPDRPRFCICRPRRHRNRLTHTMHCTGSTIR